VKVRDVVGILRGPAKFNATGSFSAADIAACSMCKNDKMICQVQVEAAYYSINADSWP
jgi:hypothetical protein